MEKDFHSKQEGFLRSELLHDLKTDQWIIIQHWSSLEHMKEASRKMFNNPMTEVFVKSIDPQSVKILMIPQIRSWDMSGSTN